MKKIIALALSLMLLLGCASALAEKNSVTMLNAFTIEFDQLPDGYSMKPPIRNDEMEYLANITSTDPTKPAMTLLISFSDDWSGVETLADATPEDIEAVKQDFYDVLEFDDGDLVYTDATTGEGTPVLLVRSVDNLFGAAYTVYKGHEIEIDIFADGEENAVTDDMMKNLVTFLSNVKFAAAE